MTWQGAHVVGECEDSENRRDACAEHKCEERGIEGPDVGGLAGEEVVDVEEGEVEQREERTPPEVHRRQRRADLVCKVRNHAELVHRVGHADQHCEPACTPPHRGHPHSRGKRWDAERAPLSGTLRHGAGRDAQTSGTQADACRLRRSPRVAADRVLCRSDSAEIGARAGVSCQPQHAQHAQHAPGEGVPGGLVAEAVLPVEDAGEEEHGEAHHRGDDGGHAEHVAKHPQHDGAGERRRHDLLGRRHRTHLLEARRRGLRRVWSLLLPRVLHLQRARGSGAVSNVLCKPRCAVRAGR